MKEALKSRAGADNIFVLVVLVATLAMFFLPTGFEREPGGQNVKVLVTEVDNSGVRQHGIVRTGDQQLEGRILSGSFAGREVSAVNHLFGKLELDKMFIEGDTALALLDAVGGNVLKVSLQDHYRLNVELALLGLFALLLIGYAGYTGAKALLSFIFAALAVWKILLPGMLLGWNPVLLALLITMALSLVIVFLVAGLNAKGLTAFCGSMAGITLTAALALVFGKLFSIHGAVRPFSETLLYSGLGHLDLTSIFIGGIFLASSGAVMDLAMDIASAMHEVREANPGITRLALVRSGNAVGRMVTGTMTTTLLLAYTGSFSTMLMVFIAQGTPIVNVMNIQYVAAEALHTLVGSFGLVLVAPLTAFFGGFILHAPKRRALLTGLPQPLKLVSGDTCHE